MPFKKIKYEHLLSSVIKPTRYINHELNSFHKSPSNKTINFCLAFPDVYEVGFSHLGLKILYSILNNEEDAVADRVYLPWTDFVSKLKENKIPLFGLESKVAVKEFDVLGITLQSELTFTNILHLLELSQIPIFSSERTKNDPIVIGGGPCVSNPEPMTDFFDAFLIGDGEEAIIEIKEVLKETGNRENRLAELSKIKGIYVPDFGTNKKVHIRKFMGLSDSEREHDNQLIPWIMPTHFRYVAEIMRGCTRGCRFCHAGYYYRPVREKKPEDILKQLAKEVKEFGWDESALTSLSTSDYSCIKELLFELYSITTHTTTSLSLPSMRVDTIDDDLIKFLNKMRQSGLTIAPEAGSQRLRNIINKNITEVDILKSVEIALNNNWKLIKLYFMIGLPFEEEADIDAILDLVERIIEMSRKKLRINITISPFVPKVFTPFQWSKMDSMENLIDKAKRIKRSLSRYKFIKVSYHSIETSVLECVIGRGDRKIGKLIYNAYWNGAIFDGWNECFDFDVWKRAAGSAGIEFEKYLSAIPSDSILAWDHIDIGIDKAFLIKEWQNAQNEASLEDCKNGKCSACGVCNSEIYNVYAEKKELTKPDFQIEKPENQYVFFHYRVFFEKIGIMQFVAHLDLVRMLQRIFRISRIPIVFSQGFNVHPRISPGPPLPIGVHGENEYCDFVLDQKLDLAEIEAKFSLTFPEKLNIRKVEFLENKKQRAMDFFKYEEMQIILPEDISDHFQERSEIFLKAEEWFYCRRRKGKEQTTDLKQIIVNITFHQNILTIIKKIVGASIFDILREVFEIERNETGRLEITRKRLIDSKMGDRIQEKGNGRREKS
ncbi:MAG: TIGR03960 family B12-binding radical SAM protein [Candidatus Cloacimonetes bacterium]|nr:TIGR03960 family B12-binding radical SAM protein [Candidatus Cloacimonadota bacterium]